jgi:serine/threonine protein kinase
MVEKRRYNGEKIDIWCLGVMLYTMLEAKLPFDQNGD